MQSFIKDLLITTILLATNYGLANTSSSFTLNVINGQIATTEPLIQTPVIHPSSLKLPLIGYHKSVNPFLTPATNISNNTLIFESLFHIDPKKPWIIHNLLASHISLNDRKTHLILTIKSNITYHDQTPMVIEDVAESLLFQQHKLPHIKITVDKQKQLLTLQSPSPLTPSQLIVIATSPITKQSYFKSKRYHTDIPPHSGPYTVIKHVSNHVTKLKLREAYWQPYETDHYRDIQLIHFKTNQAAYQAFKAKAIDLFQVKYLEHLQALESTQHSDLKLKTIDIHYTSNLNGFIFNLHQPLLQNLNMRQLLISLFQHCQMDHLIFKASLPTSENYLIEEPATLITQPLHTQSISTLEAKLRSLGWILKNQVRTHKKTQQALHLSILVPNTHIEKMALIFSQYLKLFGIQTTITRSNQYEYSKHIKENKHHLIYKYLPPILDIQSIKQSLSGTPDTLPLSSLSLATKSNLYHILNHIYPQKKPQTDHRHLLNEQLKSLYLMIRMPGNNHKTFAHWRTLSPSTYQLILDRFN
ncbi:MAG: ABC transporter substrate-binding protein [Pseudomonadota bacterium]|nr:ABC transporter substrate-binding protein [Pseudomonadota bacterium]